MVKQEHMHYSSFENMEICVKQHVFGDPVLGSRSNLMVLDVGGADVNGSYGQLFAGVEHTFRVVELEESEGVDAITDELGHFPYENDLFDVVMSGQTFEHTEYFWITLQEMVRVCKPDGVIVVIAPSAAPEHRYPVDCYRFMRDSYPALARLTNTILVDSWLDDRGPDHDLVGVFRKSAPLPAAESAADSGAEAVAAIPLQNDFPGTSTPEQEVRGGVEYYIPFLSRIHDDLDPQSYLEIGVEYGQSLQLARCHAVGIDPAPDLKHELSENHHLSLMLSNDFFRSESAQHDLPPLDLSFIDGMHRLENVLMDFMNIERHCHAASVVIIDDIYPNHVLQAARTRVTRHWTGDVWRIIPVLRSQRPDLLLVPIDTEPTGSLVVLGLDPANNALWEKFNVTVAWALEYPDDPPLEIIERHRSFDPRDPIVRRLFRSIRKSREQGTPPDIERLRAFLDASHPRKIAVHP
jgi:hypothetical protein